MYSYKQGLGKGLKFVLTGLAAVAVFSGFSDVSLWELLEKYLKPLVGSLTIGSVLVIFQNYVKTKFGGFGKMLGLKK